MPEYNFEVHLVKNFQVFTGLERNPPHDTQTQVGKENLGR